MTAVLALRFKQAIFFKAREFENPLLAQGIASRAANKAITIPQGEFLERPFEWEIVGILVAAYMQCPDKSIQAGESMQTLIEALEQHAGLKQTFVHESPGNLMDALGQAYAHSLLVHGHTMPGFQGDFTLMGEGRGVDLATYRAATPLPPVASPLGLISQTEADDSVMEDARVALDETRNEIEHDSEPEHDHDHHVEFETEVLADDMARIRIEDPELLPRCPDGTRNTVNLVARAGLRFQCPYMGCMLDVVWPQLHLREHHRRYDPNALHHVDIARRFYVIISSSRCYATIVWRLVPSDQNNVSMR